MPENIVQTDTVPVPKDWTETVQAIVFDFDSEDIRVLLVKNLPPPRDSKDQKPPGFGLPGGGVESKETLIRAVEREVIGETGHKVKKIIGTVKMFRKERFKNIIRLYLAEVYDLMYRVKENKEIDISRDPWMSLREVFDLPYAVSRGQRRPNPNGIYWSHRERLYSTIVWLLNTPLNDMPESFRRWVIANEGNLERLNSLMCDLEGQGRFKEYTEEKNPDPDPLYAPANHVLIALKD